MLASEVMNMSASLLNDTARATYTYTVQLPYLRMALRDLEGKLILDGSPLFQEVSADINYVANAATITVPADFFLPIRVFEAEANTTDDNSWKLMTETSWDTNSEPDTQVLTKWNFRDAALNVLPASVNREVRLHYIKSSLVTIVDDTTQMALDRALNTMGFKTAEYVARYIMNNPQRADSLEKDGATQEDAFRSALIKNNQNKVVRRKPYGLRSVVRRPYITS